MRLSFLLATTLLILNLRATYWGAPDLERDALDEHAAVLDPIQVNGLTLIPIVARGAIQDEAMLTLDEAMPSRLLRVTEVDPARVDAVHMANAAELPVFLLAGEVIVGGKQDRVIAANTVIPPHSSQLVPVRCVEHGRWSEGGDFTTAGRLAHDRLRGTAGYGEQGDVWNEVSRANRVHFTTNDTQTYRNLAELQPANVAKLAEQVDVALAGLADADRDRMIGYAVAYNGQVSAVDIFGSPALFQKLERKLLRAYFADAVEIAREPAQPPCIHAVRTFIASANRGAVERSFTTPGARTQIQRGTLAATSQVEAGGRHVYWNYIGNARVTRTPQDPTAPTGTWNCDRHLYPGYIGNSRFVPPRCDPSDPAPSRLQRTDAGARFE